MLSVLGMSCNQDTVTLYCRYVPNGNKCMSNISCVCNEGYRISSNRTTCEEGLYCFIFQRLPNARSLDSLCSVAYEGVYIKCLCSVAEEGLHIKCLFALGNFLIEFANLFYDNLACLMFCSAQRYLQKWSFRTKQLWTFTKF
jgi:hypothetical protein